MASKEAVNYKNIENIGEIFKNGLLDQCQTPTEAEAGRNSFAFSRRRMQCLALSYKKT